MNYFGGCAFMIMSSAHFHVLINADSGTARKLGRDKIAQGLQESPIKLESFDFLAAEEFNEKLANLLEGTVPVMVGGGDGTIARAAALHLQKDRPLAILPFGTMNLFAQDLNVSLDFPGGLHSYANTKTISVDVGLVNGHPFLCCAAWGTMPEAAKFREENRNTPEILLLPRLTAFIIQQMDKTRRRRIKLTLDGKSRRLRTAMLVISNNLFDPSADTESFKKKSLQSGVFGIYSVTSPTFYDKARLFFRLARGSWHQDRAVSMKKAHAVKIETKKSKELISIDGEPIEMQGPFEFSMAPRALKMIIPAA